MAKKKKEQGPPVRKSVLIVGAIGIATAVLSAIGYLAGGGGDDFEFEEDTPTTQTSAAPGAPAGGGAVTAPVATAAPTPTPKSGLTPGGRDPFAPANGAPQAAAVESVTEEAPPVDDEPTKFTVLQTYGSAADLQVGDLVLEGVQQNAVLSPRFDLDEISGSCVYIKDAGERFKVCKGKSVTR